MVHRHNQNSGWGNWGKPLSQRRRPPERMSRTMLIECTVPSAPPCDPGWLNKACEVTLMAKPTTVSPMKTTRPLNFWIVTFGLFAATVVLLHHVLLPFVTAATLSYLLD